MNEHLFKVEEFHRGKWQPLMAGEKQKIARITDEQAEILNSQSKHKNIRYVKEDAKAEEDTKPESNEELESVKAEYEKVIGKKPHHLKGIDSMKEEIAEAQKQS